MNLKFVVPDPAHKAYRDALVNTLKAEGKDLDALVLLAIAAHFVGQLAAMQDQRKYSPSAVMEVVTSNIMQGNRDAVDSLALAQTPGGMQ